MGLNVDVLFIGKSLWVYYGVLFIGNHYVKRCNKVRHILLSSIRADSVMFFFVRLTC